MTGNFQLLLLLVSLRTVGRWLLIDGKITKLHGKNETDSDNVDTIAVSEVVNVSVLFCIWKVDHGKPD
jgi:hypothetical protein